MALSKVWTVKKLFDHVLANVNAIDSVAYAQRFEIINKLQYQVASEFYGIIYRSYMQSAPVVTSATTGIYSTLATPGSYTAATKEFVFPTVASRTFIADDVHKFLIFRTNINEIIYGIVESVVSTTVVTLSGVYLPTSNKVITEAMLLGSVLGTGDVETASLASLNIMRVGQHVHMELESTATSVIHPVQVEEFRTWSKTSTYNRETIIWYLLGEVLYLKKSSSLSSYGTLTLFYPRVPTEVVADANYIDVPDGTMASLIILLLRKELASKSILPKTDLSADIASSVEAVYRSYGLSLKSEDLESKVKALQ